MPLVWVSLIAYIRFLFMRYPSSPKRSKPHKEKPSCTPVPPHSPSYPPSAARPSPPPRRSPALPRLVRRCPQHLRRRSPQGARPCRDARRRRAVALGRACGIVAARLADHPAIGNMRCGGVRHAVAVPRAVLRLRGNRRAPGHVRATRFRPAGRSRRRVRRRRGARVRLEEPAPCSYAIGRQLRGIEFEQDAEGRVLALVALLDDGGSLRIVSSGVQCLPRPKDPARTR